MITGKPILRAVLKFEMMEMIVQEKEEKMRLVRTKTQFILTCPSACQDWILRSCMSKASNSLPESEIAQIQGPRT